MVPTDKGLHDHGVSGRELDRRLVLEQELAFLDGAPQLASEADPAIGVLAHGDVEQFDPAPSRCLGLVHGGVRLPQQRIAVIAGLGRHSDSDTGAGRVMTGGKLHGLRKGLRDARGPVKGLRGPREAFAKHDELVPAEAGEGIAWLAGCFQQERHRREDLVADVVSERVVDDLELVEVEQDYADATALGGGVSRAASSRSINVARFANPVSGSWEAW